MHEFLLINDLVKKIQRLASEQQPNTLRLVTIELGALSHISAGHFREHFEQAVAGTELEHIGLSIECSDDIHSPTAQDILIKSIDILEV